LAGCLQSHGFKIFAIEADFGESMFINQAVLNSDRSQIESLMKEKMHFWTWRTNEVRDLLYWMCDYNLGKTEAEKVQYWGVDCQFNTYHPDMVEGFLEMADVSFISFGESVLNEARSASSNRFSGYTQNTFDTYLGKVNALKDSLTKYEPDIIGAGSGKQYQVTLQLVDVIGQVSEVIYYGQKQNHSKNYRDEYMAKNTAWLHEYFEDAKIVLWAHNFHVSDFESAGAMGHYLKADFQDDYETLGFLFSKGSFMAVTQTGDQFFGLNSQSLEDDPKPGSLNDVMFRAEVPAFTVKLSHLQNHDAWKQKFGESIEYFHMGATYTNEPSTYYSAFSSTYFDRLIYFNRSTASVQVK
jgi:erythromycin esterase